MEKNPVFCSLHQPKYEASASSGADKPAMWNWLHMIAHLNLSDIPHNWRRCVDADSTWESSQDSFGRVIQSLVDVVNLHFLKKAAQQRGGHLLWLHEYFTSKNQDGKKAQWFQQIIYTQAVKHISDPPPVVSARKGARKRKTRTGGQIVSCVWLFLWIKP